MSPSVSPNQTTAGGAARILVVDDSQVVRRALSRLLEEMGHQVTTAASGEEAFEQCLEQTFDLIVTDITMGALSGVQLTRLLRSDTSTASTPILMLTASDDPKSRFWGRNAGADAYLAKESMATALGPEVERLLTSAPRKGKTGTFRVGRRAKPLERLSQVLDHLLFQAVVASEVRSLAHHIDDRRAFARSVISLAGEVASYAYLSLRLDGVLGPTFTIHARQPWPAEPTPAALSALGLNDVDVGRVDVLREGPPHPDDVLVESGEMAFFPVEAGGERLGELCVFGGTKRVAGTDRATLELIGREMGLAAKSLFLMEQTRQMAHTDGLTGLPNRRRCVDRLAHEVERSDRQTTAFSIAICDVDHFKKVNDSYGHNVGDSVLKVVASTLAATVRRIDLVGRWGGEEFMVLLPNASCAGGRVVAERLRAAVEAAVCPEGPRNVTVSFGIACHQDGETPEQLVDRADTALYRAKKRGRNRVELALPKSVTEET